MPSVIHSQLGSHSLRNISDSIHSKSRPHAGTEGDHRFCYVFSGSFTSPYRPLSRGAMLSLRRNKSFVFARQASPKREFCTRLVAQKQSSFISLRLNMAAERQRSIGDQPCSWDISLPPSILKEGRERTL